MIVGRNEGRPPIVSNKKKKIKKTSIFDDIMNMEPPNLIKCYNSNPVLNDSSTRTNNSKYTFIKPQLSV